MPSFVDLVIQDVDLALRTLTGTVRAARPMPAASTIEAPDNPPMAEGERRHAAGLMRVNHVGEVCAQALYRAQARGTQDDELKQHFDEAAREEGDHLAWTRDRLEALGGRPSWLNPLWYGGAYALGALAARAGDAVSLGFVVETERQVEQHLEGHLARLPKGDQASRAVLEQMAIDEARHGASAKSAGARLLPWPLRVAMRGMARVMTSTAYWI